MQKSDKGLSANFIVVWVGQLISSIGNGLTAFALGIYVFQLTNSAARYSMIILFAFLPTFILQPFGGTLSDRFDRRLMMIIGDFGSALGLVFILLMMYSGFNDLWIIYAGVSFSAVFAAVQIPAYKSSVTDLLDAAAYSKASGLMQLSESSKYIISPIVAGVLLTFWDIKNLLIIDILSFILAIFAVFVIKKNAAAVKPETAEQNFFGDFVSGFRYTITHKGLIWLLFIISLIKFFVGFLQTLLGPMMLVITDSETYGTSLTLMASGMLVSSLFIGVFSKSKKHLLILSVALGFCGLFFASLGISRNIILIIASGFLFFLSLPFVNTNLDVLIRRNVENEIQGRVWSNVSVISQIGMVIAFGIAGFLADYVFNPLFEEGGMLASSLGKITGAGPGRGIAFIFFLSGIFILIISFVIYRIKVIKALDTESQT